MCDSPSTPPSPPPSTYDIEDKPDPFTQFFEWLGNQFTSIEEEMGPEMAALFVRTVISESMTVPDSVEDAKRMMKGYLRLKNLSRVQFDTLVKMIDGTVGQNILPEPELGEFSNDELVEMRDNVFESFMTVYGFSNREFDAQTPYQELSMELNRRLNV